MGDGESAWEHISKSSWLENDVIDLTTAHTTNVRSNKHQRFPVITGASWRKDKIANCKTRSYVFVFSLNCVCMWSMEMVMLCVVYFLEWDWNWKEPGTNSNKQHYTLKREGQFSTWRKKSRCIYLTGSPLRWDDHDL